MTTWMKMAALLGALALPACGAPEEGDGEEGVDQELSSGFTYHCAFQGPAGGPEVARIRLGVTHAKVVAVDPSLTVAAETYDYYPGYHPRTATHESMSKYVFHNPSSHDIVLLVDTDLRTGGHALRSGALGGSAIVQGPQFNHNQNLLCHR
jgi:hypothetical protein